MKWLVLVVVLIAGCGQEEEELELSEESQPSFGSNYAPTLDDKFGFTFAQRKELNADVGENFCRASYDALRKFPEPKLTSANGNTYNSKMIEWTKKHNDETYRLDKKYLDILYKERGVEVPPDGGIPDVITQVLVDAHAYKWESKPCDE